MSNKFKLSSSLLGHSSDVRSVVVTSTNAIISGSRDKTAKLWVPNLTQNTYTLHSTYQDQKNFVITVFYLEPTAEYPDGLVVTGGNDNVINVYKPAESSALFSLREHTNAVSCLAKYTSTNSFISGSWDTNAKIWIIGNTKSLITLSGHTAAIWAVVQLRNSQIITGSADKSISIWSNDGHKINTLTGHTDCVRALLDLPELQQFVSAANDATVRIWSYLGDSVRVLYGHTNYIYSIARCTAFGTNCFVTCDEDRTVRFWKDNENLESICLPAQSVWSVGCLSNGDIITGSSDGVIRIFSQDKDRYADEATLKHFDEEVEAVQRQSNQEIGGYKISDLPGKEALYDPGKKPGQMKMVREDGKVVAYTWVDSGDSSHWEKVGDVLGGTNKNENKTSFEGKEYDFVFTVDVEDGKPPLKLPFNKGDDPYKAAHNFLSKNFLPSSYLEQVVDFILKNADQQCVLNNSEYADPFTGESRYTPSSDSGNYRSMGSNLDPFTGGSSYTTAEHLKQNLSKSESNFFPLYKYRTFDIGDKNVILNKLKEYNKKLNENDAVNEKYLEALVKLCDGPPDDPNAFDILFKLLEWNDEIIFPVIDVIRLAVRFKTNNDVIATSNNGSILQKLLGFINENCKVANNLIISLRTLSNLLLHDCGELLVFDHRFEIIENITTLGVLNKNGQIALATILLNLTIASLKKKDDLGISVLADVIPDILTKLNEPESQFRAYVALGTLLTIAPCPKIEISVKVVNNSQFVNILKLHINSSSNDPLERKRQNCASQLGVLLGVS